MASPNTLDQDDDEISLTSTVGEEYDEDEEFEVLRILTEKVLRGRHYFLIWWENYPEESSTWEPEHQISASVIAAWRERQVFEQQNPSESYDLLKFEAKLKQLDIEKARRHLRRNAKRKRLGIPISVPEFDAEEADESESSIEAAKDDEIEKQKEKEKDKEMATARPPSLKRKGSSPDEITKKPLKEPAGRNIMDHMRPGTQSSIDSIRRKDSIPAAQSANRSLDHANNLHTAKGISTASATGRSTCSEKTLRRMSTSSLDTPLMKTTSMTPSTTSGNRVDLQSQDIQVVDEASSTNTASHTSVSVRGSSRGVSSNRGRRAATRGGIAHKNVFVMGKSSTTRAPRGNLLTNAANTTKMPTHFTNKRLERKALIQGREKADAAPDISAVPGGLFNPSSVTSIEPIRPGNLRKSSATENLPKSDDLLLGNSDNYDLMEVDSHVQSFPAPKYQQPTFTMSTCYYWHNQQSSSNAPPCQKGASCEYLHSYREGAPIAPTPVARFSSYDQPRDLTCFFWDKSERDKNQLGCSKGSTCMYLHEYRTGIPIAPAPTGFASYALNSGTSMPQHQSILNDSSDDLNGPRRFASTLSSQILSKEATSFSAEPLATKSFEEDFSVSAHSDRPPWDPSRPIHSICHFYWTRGDCSRGSSCKYYHTNDGNLPIAPAPGARTNFEPQTCWDLLRNGVCNFPNCRFAHPSLSAISSPPKQTQETFHRASGESRIVKSVKFADEDSVTHQSFASKTMSDSRDFDSMRPKIADEQKESRIAAGLEIRGKYVIFGSHETKSFFLDFSGIDSATSSEWKDIWKNTTTIKFTQKCVAQDFSAQQGFFKRRQLQQTPRSLVPGAVNDVATIKALKSIAKELVLTSAGLVSILQNPSFGIGILVYPAKTEEWKFLDQYSDPSEVCLRYFVFQCDLDVLQFFSNKSSGLSISKPYRTPLAERLNGLELTTLLPFCQKGQENAYNFFLLFPNTARQSEELITLWIKTTNSKSKIHSSRNEGAWKFFAHNPTIDAGVVLVDATAAGELFQLHSLFGVVNNAKKPISFWCLSDFDTPYAIYPSRYSPEALDIGRFKHTRLFTRGSAFLVTPSFLVAEPQKAHDLFCWFLTSPKAKYATTTPRSWKLVCSHNLLDYLLTLAIAKVVEKEDFEAKNYNKPTKDAMLKERGLSYDICEVRFKLHALLAKLDNQSMLEPPSDLEDIEFESDSSVDSERPFVYADRSIEPDDEPSLIKWFAGWSIRNSDRFKKFVIVGTDGKSSVRAMRTSESNSNISSAMEKALAVAAKYKPETPLPSPNVTDGLPPGEAGSDAIMGSGVDESSGRLSTVDFMQRTGSNIADADKFLKGAGYDVSLAIELYANEEAMNELIITERGKGQDNVSQRPGLSINDSIPGDDGMKERPSSPSAIASRTPRFSFTFAEKGQRSLPRSVRPTDSSISKEIISKPGYIPSEDKASQQLLNLRGDSDQTSGCGNTAIEGKSGSDTLAVHEQNRLLNSKEVLVKQPEKVKMEIKYEATTEWYKKLVEERGYGWEHIYIGSWEKAFLQLGLTK